MLLAAICIVAGVIFFRLAKGEAVPSFIGMAVIFFAAAVISFVYSFRSRRKRKGDNATGRVVVQTKIYKRSDSS